MEEKFVYVEWRHYLDNRWEGDWLSLEVLAGLFAYPSICEVWVNHHRYEVRNAGTPQWYWKALQAPCAPLAGMVWGDLVDLRTGYDDCDTNDW